MTTGILLLTVPLWPLLLATLALVLRRYRVGGVLAVCGALPALAVSLMAPFPDEASYAWLLLGVRFGLGEADTIILLFTAVVWLLAGMFARTWVCERRERFFAIFLLTMSGNLGALVAQDMPSFYACFALMSFATYGLVAHKLTSEAKHAANVYIVLVVIGEAALAAALMLAAGAVGASDFVSVRAGLEAAPLGQLIIALAFLGFGIKAGVLLLHVWLPLAHPVAPAPASAVLSGTVIVTGLVGWLRFLPVGEWALPGWGGACIVLGLAAAFYGAFVGIDQRNPKVVLAYSSISQMGIMTVGVGMLLREPALAESLHIAIAFFALHHGLAKSALFLGTGLALAGMSEPRRRWLVAGLALPSLALAGAPFTSGMVAKSALAAGEAALSEPWAAAIEHLLPLTSVATTLLMARFLVLVSRGPIARQPRATRETWLAWWVSLVLALVLPWSLVPATQVALTPPMIVGGLWPLALAFAIALIAIRSWRRAGRPTVPEIPAGDVLLPLEWLTRRVRHAVVSVAHSGQPLRDQMQRAAATGRARAWSLVRGTGGVEALLTRWPVALTLAVLVGIVVVLITGLR